MRDERETIGDTALTWGPANCDWFHIAINGAHGNHCVTIGRLHATALLTSLGQWLAENERAAGEPAKGTK